MLICICVYIDVYEHMYVCMVKLHVDQNEGNDRKTFLKLLGKLKSLFAHWHCPPGFSLFQDGVFNRKLHKDGSRRNEIPPPTTPFSSFLPHQWLMLIFAKQNFQNHNAKQSESGGLVPL